MTPIPYQKNTKKHPDSQLQKIAKSLREFGWRQPILVDKDDVIIAGHGRWMAYNKYPEGIKEPWIEKAVDLSPEQVTRYRLMDNKTNESEWDNDLLAEFEASMLADVGFDSKELDKIFADKKSHDDFDGDKEAEKIVTPNAKHGELYQLGRHRLMCGDSSNQEDVAKLRGGGLADMVFTDPPYNVDYAGRGKSTSTKIMNDNMDEAEFRTMLGKWFLSYAQSLKETGALYCCYASRTHREFEDAINANGFEVRNQIIWVKKVASMGWGDYRWKHEPILYCHKKGAPLDFFGDRKQYTEWTEEMSDEELLKMVKGMITKEEEGESTVWRLHREMKYDHPTQKPVKLVSIAIRNSSKRGDVVLDLFGGSFSTMVAAHELSRTCWTMELDARYVDVGIKRMLKLDPTLELKRDGVVIDKTPWLK